MSENQGERRADATHSGSMRSTVIRALRWYAGIRYLGQLFTWGITIVVIRLLTPEDYGLIAMASILIGLAIMVGEVGIGGALIQSPKLDNATVRKLFGFLIITNVPLYILVFILSPIFASFFNADKLTHIIRILDFQVLISVFSVIPIALLKRQMDFKQLAFIELAAAIIGSLTALGMAWYGFGVWSLVASNLATTMVLTLSAIFIVGLPQWPSFRFGGIRSQLAFVARIVASSFVSFLYTQSDTIIIGRIIGSTQLGYYTVANNIALLPMNKFTTIMSSVSFPAYSQIRHDKDKIQNYFLRSLEINLFIFTPFLWGISSISKDLIDLVLGDRWGSAVVVLQIISLIVPLRMLSPLVQAMLLGIGRVEITLRNVFTNLMIVPPALLIGTQWGLSGVCFGWVIGFSVAFPINLRRTFLELDLHPKEFWILTRATFVCAATMYVAAMGANHYLLDGLEQIPRLVLSVSIGAAVYTCLSLVLNRGCVERTWGLIKG